MHVLELVRWRGISAKADQDMAQAMAAILPDLQDLPGYQSHTLYRAADESWLAVYRWDTATAAHASNDLMAEKPGFQALMALIAPETVTSEVFDPS